MLISYFLCILNYEYKISCFKVQLDVRQPVQKLAYSPENIKRLTVCIGLNHKYLEKNST